MSCGWLIDHQLQDNLKTSELLFDCWRPVIAHQRPRNPPAGAASSDEELQEHHEYCWPWCRLTALSIEFKHTNH
jgi:hypothetical protein